jgi:trimethylamine--corrinoid protein Co-methyltransferase
LDDATGEHVEATPELVRRLGQAAEASELVAFSGRGVMLDGRNVEAVRILARATGKTIYAGLQHAEEAAALEPLCRERGGLLVILDPIHSPLTLAENMVPRLLEAARRRLPLILASMPMPAITAPYSMTGMLTLALAEYLAGLVIVQTLAPGLLAVCGALPTVTDLSRGYALDFGGKYHNVANMLMAQIPLMLDLPACQSGCTTNERTLTARAVADARAGYALFLRHGCHMIRHAFGFTRDLLAFSFAKQEAVARAYRETTADDAPPFSWPSYDEGAFDAIARCAGPGSFRDDPHTTSRVGLEFTDR